MHYSESLPRFSVGGCCFSSGFETWFPVPFSLRFICRLRLESDLRIFDVDQESAARVSHICFGFSQQGPRPPKVLRTLMACPYVCIPRQTNPSFPLRWEILWESSASRGIFSYTSARLSVSWKHHVPRRSTCPFSSHLNDSVFHFFSQKILFQPYINNIN